MQTLSSQIGQYFVQIGQKWALVPTWAQFTGGEEQFSIKTGQPLSHLLECSSLTFGLMSPEGGEHLSTPDILPEMLHPFTQPSWFLGTAVIDTHVLGPSADTDTAK